MTAHHDIIPDSQRQIVTEAIAHLDHVLPGQAPIHDFVHHNTLHGFQHLPFEQALAEFAALTGIDCYLPEAQFRQYYSQGRIDDTDLSDALAQHFGNEHQTAVWGDITRQTLYKLALLHDFPAVTEAEWRWQLLEEGLLQHSYADGLQNAALWQILMKVLDLQPYPLHPEQLLDLSEEQAADWFTVQHAGEIAAQSRQDMRALFAAVGDSLTIRGLLQALTGSDILEKVRPQLIRVCASVLDEGMAAWRLPQCENLGFYPAWLQLAAHDAEAFFQELDGWDEVLQNLPTDAESAIAQQLQALAIPEPRWAGYLRRLALELPGWSGLINWRHTHPAYRADGAARPGLADYLAIRLVLDRVYAQQLCRQHWRCALRLDKLQAYFEKNSAECSVRQALYQAQLPEYLLQQGRALQSRFGAPDREWHTMAERIWIWRHSPSCGHPAAANLFDQGWRLFRLCQCLCLAPEQVLAAGKTQLLTWLDIVSGFDAEQRKQVWLQAYERHYRQDLLQALHANHNRGRWSKRRQRPAAQIVFCMDDREEGIRRHLEEFNPAVETLGAAGFFGLPMHYRGLDDAQSTPLCPVVVTPAHNVVEQSGRGQEAALLKHRRRISFKQSLTDLWFHGLRRHNVSAVPTIMLASPLALGGLLLKSFFPKGQQRLMNWVGQLFVQPVATELNFKAPDYAEPATPQQPRLGFTDQEQAERVAAFLRNTGLTYGFAELVVLMGHGSISQNNPHLAAYDCGACSGRHGGPNARLFAAMANRPEVRRLLAERGILIPSDTWFVGAEHNTCDEELTWYDTAEMPAERKPALQRFIGDMQHAQRMSAHERCRRLASAPLNPSPRRALRHFLGRAADFSQARPELGHATNAAALVGRRSLTQGTFFDRRLFLISYDPTQDADGSILESILLAVGPVGAGINLEYYFSTVNNDRLGCGSKVPHNVTGFCAVMEGAGSDLRTGLPRQMIEIHEAMRLQLVVEAKTAILEQIYARQDSLRELIGGGWIHLSAKDPDSGQIFVFRRGSGFEPWQPEDRQLPLRPASPDCYRGSSEPVPAMLIEQVEISSEVC